MAALPYMQLYIADYLADTMHLSTEEHGAYLLLMFNYWQTGRAIPKNRLAKIARVSDEKWSEIEETLSEFFECDDDSWVHLRIERDLESVTSSPGGKRTGKGFSHEGYLYFITGPDLDRVKIAYTKNPWARLKELRSSYGSNLVATTVKVVEKNQISVATIFSSLEIENGWFVKNKPIEALISAINEGVVTTVADISDYVVNYANYCSESTVATTSTTNKDKDPDKDKELKDPPLNPPKEKSGKNKFDPLSVELPEWLSPVLWAEWIGYRKQLGKPLKTQQGVSGAINKLTAYREQGHSPEFVVNLTMSNQWVGLLVPDGMVNKPRRDVNQISQPDSAIPPGFRG